MSAFGDQLKTVLGQAGMSQMDLARALKTSSSVVSQTCSGQRLPPLERIAAWADALGLKAARKEAFIAAAHLAHAPERVRQQVKRLQAGDGQAEPAAAARRVGEGALDDEAVAEEVAIAIAECLAGIDPQRHPTIPQVDLAWVGHGILDTLLRRFEGEWIPSSASSSVRAVQAVLMEAAVDFQGTLRPSDPATIGPALRRLGASLAHARALLVPDKRSRRPH